MPPKKKVPPPKPAVVDKTPAFDEDAPVEIQAVLFNEKTVEFHEPKNIASLKKLIHKDKVNLIFIDNLTEPRIIEQISSLFNINPLIMEDALSEADIPSVQESGEQMLLTLKLMEFGESGKLVARHIGLLLGDYFVLVFKDSENLVFNDVKKRIENGTSKARFKNPDYLFYLLLDSVIDTYYTVVNEIDNKIDRMEIILLEKPETNYISNLYRIKQPMMEMRNVIYPTREALTSVLQGDYHLIADETLPFLKDVKDHVNNIVTMFDSSRDTLSDLLEINNSNINNRLNSTMKVLTIITTLFIPLTLITGIYGMNFKNLPGVSLRWGYLLVLGFMLITAGIMYLIMKRKKIL